jgi:hypothetical protein
MGGTRVAADERDGEPLKGRVGDGEMRVHGRVQSLS